MEARIRETINDSPLFKHLDGEQLDALVESASLESYEAGQHIIEEGRRVQNLYIVIEGRVRVWTQSNGRTVELKTLGPGAYFGEVSLLSKKDATASVEAKSDELKLVALARDAVMSLVEEDEKVRKMLEGVTLARAKDTIGKVLK